METLNVFRLLIIFLKRYDIDARQGHKHESVCHGNLLCKAMDWFLYDQDLRHERVKNENLSFKTQC